jgi:hypothetical protein
LFEERTGTLLSLFLCGPALKSTGPRIKGTDQLINGWHIHTACEEDPDGRDGTAGSQ